MFQITRSGGLDLLLEGFPWGTAFGATPARVFPQLNLWEDEANVHAECELPGLRLDDLEVTVLGSKLTIRGERKTAAPEGASSLRRERSYGEFSRTVELPIEIDAEKVEATLENGVLKVRLPKAKTALPRRIEVKQVAK
jgi:HSP20 family protein